MSIHDWFIRFKDKLFWRQYNLMSIPFILKGFQITLAKMFHFGCEPDAEKLSFLMQ